MSNVKASQNRSLTVSVIGSGRLGTALAIALTKVGYAVKAVVARHSAHARKAATLLNDDPLVLSRSQLKKLPPTDLVLITTPDDALEEVAKTLAETQTGKTAGRTVLHTSGALSSEILAPLSREGFYAGSLHPLVAVSDPVKGAAALRGAFWCVEGDIAAARQARAIVRELAGQSFSVSAEKKPLYHAAAVMASGHLVALFDIALEMLTSCGLTKSTARKVLLPLVKSTTSNLLVAEPAEALTGTFARGDLATVQRHLRALNSHGEALAVYRILGIRALELAQKNGADPQTLKRIKRLLASSRQAKR